METTILGLCSISHSRGWLCKKTKEKDSNRVKRQGKKTRRKKDFLINMRLPY
jgi:hypothetical protein